MVNVLIAVVLVAVAQTAVAQDRTSSNNGAWENNANWGGQSFPPLAGQDYGTISVSHNLLTSAAFTVKNGTLNIAATKTMTVEGNFTTTGGGQVNVYGTLLINGSANINARINVHPGGKVVVTGDVTVQADHYLRIGDDGSTNLSKADFVVQGNLIAQGSGDVTVYKQGRLAVFGDMNATGGGTFLNISSGGQVYVDGDGTGSSMNFAAGGNVVNNNNANITHNGNPTPYGFYVNGTVSDVPGQGSVVDADRGDKTTLKDTNSDFYNWLVSQSTGSFSTLPIELISFAVRESNAEGIVLEWATAQEKNFHYFEVQRADEELVFETVGKVYGKGGPESMLRTYSFTDSGMDQQRVYYRLKNVDIGGTFTYSHAISAHVEHTAAELLIYPNPVSGKQSIHIMVIGETNRTVEVVSESGSRVTVWQLHGHDNEVLMDNLDPGVYYLRTAGGRPSRIIKLD